MIKSLVSRLTSKTSMAILTLFSVGFAIYQTYIYERRGHLVVGVSAVSKVFDIHREVGGLDVLYEGERLRDTKRVLWSVAVTLRNEGNAEIRKSDFDESVPFSLSTMGSVEIAGVPTVTASNDYLTKHLKFSASKTSIRVEPAIWEIGDTVHLSLVVLAPEGVKPKLSSSGKLAGMRGPPPVVAEDEDSKDIPTWQAAIEAKTIWVHLARLPIYSLLSLALLITAFVVGATVESSIDSYRERRRKQERTQAALGLGETIADPKVRKLILSSYVESGRSGLRVLRRALESEKKMRTLLSVLSEEIPLNERKLVALRTYGGPFSRLALFKDMDNDTLRQFEQALDEIQRVAGREAEGTAGDGPAYVKLAKLHGVEDSTDDEDERRMIHETRLLFP